MTLTKHESADSSPSRGDNTRNDGSGITASERFLQDIQPSFRGTQPREDQSLNNIRLADAGPRLSNSGERTTVPKSENSDASKKPVPGERVAAPERDRAGEGVSARQFNEFARANGLELHTTPDRKLEFSLRNGGEKTVLGSVEPTRAGMQEITKSLKEFTELKKWDLEQRFGVQFASPGGEQRIHQQVQGPDGAPKPGKELNLREPKLRELLGIEAALEKANPSHKVEEGGKPLTFYFLKDSTYYRGAGGVATFEPQVNGGAAVIVEPTSLNDSPITERDRKGNNFSDHRSIESVIIHELGHHTEERLNRTPQQKAETYSQIGWTPIPGMPASPQGDQQWMLKGKNGEGYAPAGVTPGAWVRFDRNGRELGKMQVEQAANLAQVKPSTRYFEGPHEMLAEGLTMLRLGDGYRSHLMNGSSNLYQAVKQFDQRDLDKAYGPGKFMRSFSGHVVEQTSQNLRLLKEHEERALQNNR